MRRLARRPRPGQSQSGKRGRFTKAKTFSGIPEQEIPDSLPRVRPYSMADMKMLLDRAGLTNPSNWREPNLKRRFDLHRLD
jgi:hypothetical protein